MALANSMQRASPKRNATPEIKLEFCKPAGSQGLKKLESLCDKAAERAAGAQGEMEANGGAPEKANGGAPDKANGGAPESLAETKTPVGGRTCSVRMLAAKVMAARQSLQADRAEARVTTACTRT